MNYRLNGDLFGGGLLRGAAITSGSTRLAELAARMGFEAIWIEMEHGPTDFSVAEAMCTAVEASGAVPAIRVPDGQRHHVLRALEVGARIVIVPMINTAEHAKQIVQFGKFPPLGRRGYNTRSRGVNFGVQGPAQEFAEANARTHLLAQVETIESVKNLDKICAVKGLSGILIGPGDLSMSMGITGELKNPKLIKVVTDCIRRAKKHGKHTAILIAQGPMLDAAIEAGCDLVFCGGDVSDLTKAWTESLQAVGEKNSESPALRAGAKLDSKGGRKR